MTEDEDVDGLAMRVATSIGLSYGLSGSQIMTIMAIGDRRHSAAPADECGVIYPFDENEDAWCRRPLRIGKHENHNVYPLDEDWPERAASGDVLWWTKRGMKAFISEND